MKTEIKVETDTWLNGQKQHETPYVNGQRHGLATWWHDNGQKLSEIPYVNGQMHGLAIWLYPNGQKMYETPYTNGQIHGLCTGWLSDSVLRYVQKWHQDQKVWEMNLYSKEQISEDAEVELFFHETPELT